MAINHVWRRVREEAGLIEFRMHNLRHSFAVETGESLYILQRALGHRKAITTRRYAHLRDDPVQAMVERVGMRILAARTASDRSGQEVNEEPSEAQVVG